MRGIRMRTVIGWMAAMVASALLGAVVYQTVLSKPLAELDPTATVETITRAPVPGPTLYRTEVRTVVEPTPTVTVEEEVLIQEESVQVSQPRTTGPAPVRTPTARPTPRATTEREDDNSTESAARESDDTEENEAEDAEDAAKEAQDAAEDAAEEAQDAVESDD
jgi:type IV secretory pathway VirB10-like protein